MSLDLLLSTASASKYLAFILHWFLAIPCWPNCFNSIAAFHFLPFCSLQIKFVPNSSLSQ